MPRKVRVLGMLVSGLIVGYVNLSVASGLWFFSSLHFSRGIYILHEINETIKYLSTPVCNCVLHTSKDPRNNYIYVDHSATDMMKDGVWVEKHHDDLIGWLKLWWSKRKMMLWQRLIEISESPDEFKRMKSINALSRLRYLEDHEIHFLSQLTKPQTAVALARAKNIDSRYFRKPKVPVTEESKQDLIDQLQDLLQDLNSKNYHACIDSFLKRQLSTFKRFTTEQKIYGGNEISSVYGFRSMTKDEMLQSCIESLVHHCTLHDNIKDIVSSGGLALLMSVYNILSTYKECSLQLGRLITEASQHPELLPHLFTTGWIGVVAKWANQSDQKLSIPAASALANLDQDYCLAKRYGSQVFLLHPLHRTQEKIKVDIVLVHGLLGGIYYTWKQRLLSDTSLTLFSGLGITSTGNTVESARPRIVSRIQTVQDLPACEFDDNRESCLGSDYQFVFSDLPLNDRDGTLEGPYSLSGEDQRVQEAALSKRYSYCWPRDWLPSDCKSIRIVGINYETNLSDWFSWCSLREFKRAKSLDTKSDHLIEQLTDCGIGDRPIVWIAHSMGGLLVKKMLLKALDASEEKYHRLHENTRAIIFLSTPHLGSPLASLSDYSQLLLLPSPEVKELSVNSPVLLDLHKQFLDFLELRKDIEILTFVERECMKITSLGIQIQCVPPQCGDLGTGPVYEIPLGHSDICKPDSRLSFIYQKIMRVVLSVVNST